MQALLKKNWLAVITLALAAAQFARCYGALTIEYMSLRDYANGTALMPYQGRMLMMLPLRWAANSAALQRFCVGRHFAFRTPEMVVVTIVAWVCICATCLIVAHMFHRLNPGSGRVAGAALVLGIATVQYILHLSNVVFPYDLPSLFFFTLSLYFIYTRRVWAMVLLFPVATLNRETTLFLPLLLALDVFATEGWRGLRRARFLVPAAAMGVVWAGLHVYVERHFAGNGTQMGSRVALNAGRFVQPLFWPQIAAAGAFLLPFIFVYRDRIACARLRAYLWIIPPWFVVMFYFGELTETRIFGELTGLIALAAALEMERSAPSAPVVY